MICGSMLAPAGIRIVASSKAGGGVADSASTSELRLIACPMYEHTREFARASHLLSSLLLSHLLAFVFALRRVKSGAAEKAEAEAETQQSEGRARQDSDARSSSGIAIAPHHHSRAHTDTSRQVSGQPIQRSERRGRFRSQRATHDAAERDNQGLNQPLASRDIITA